MFSCISLDTEVAHIWPAVPNHALGWSYCVWVFSAWNWKWKMKKDWLHNVMVGAGKSSLCSDRSTRMLTHATQMLEAAQRDPLELETGSFPTWGGEGGKGGGGESTKASSSCSGCWLHTSCTSRASLQPAQPPASPGKLPCCSAFLTDPTVTFLKLQRFHSIFCNETSVTRVQCAAVIGWMW